MGACGWAGYANLSRIPDIIIAVIHVCMYVCMNECMYICMHVCMYVCINVCMTSYMHILYVGFDYTCIQSFLASQVWFQAFAGARAYETDSTAITSQSR